MCYRRREEPHLAPLSKEVAYVQREKVRALKDRRAGDRARQIKRELREQGREFSDSTEMVRRDRERQK